MIGLYNQWKVKSVDSYNRLLKDIHTVQYQGFDKAYPIYCVKNVNVNLGHDINIITLKWCNEGRSASSKTLQKPKLE